MTTESPVRQYPFAQFLHARSATAPIVAPDGQSIAFLSDITGFNQVWSVPVQGGWPDQLTFTADRVQTARYAHHVPILVYGTDAGGNEREQLYALENGVTRSLAVDPAVMHYIGAISPDDRQLAFSDNRRHPAHFDVYTVDLDGGNERCVYQQDGSNMVADWSHDGASLLIQRRTGSLDQELFLLDLASGEARHLTPHQVPVQYGHAHFAPDDRSIYLTTDAGSEFTRAARLDLAGGEIEFLTPDDADIDDVALSPDGSRLALIRNQQGYGHLVVRTLATGEEREPSGVPAGVPAQCSWSEDGSLLTFALAAPQYNSNIWVWNLSSNDCRQVTRVGTAGIPAEDLGTPELISFRSFDGLEIPAFLYMPATGAKPPVVVHVHGGPESQARPVFNPVIQYLVNRGYAVLVPNVRGSTGYGRTYTHLDDVEKRMDSVADLQAAAEWLRASGRVNGDRMAVMGGSYGGFMVLSALTTYPEYWAAGVDIVGLANLDTFFKNTGAYRRHWRTPEYGDPAIHGDLFRRISPIHHVDRIRAPLIVIHGDNDPRVPVNETEQIVEALSSRGIPVELIRFPDEGHGVAKLKNKLVAYPAIGDFLDRYLMQ